MQELEESASSILLHIYTLMVVGGRDRDPVATPLEFDAVESLIA